MSLTIGGLPAERFVGRQIRFRSSGSGAKMHLMPARLVAVVGDRLELVPHRHTKSEIVEPMKVSPWWSRNPDLKKEAADAKAARELCVAYLPTTNQDELQHHTNTMTNEVSAIPCTTSTVGAEASQTIPPSEPSTWPQRDGDAMLNVPVNCPPTWLGVYAAMVRAETDAEECLVMHRSLLNDAGLLRAELGSMGVRFCTTPPAITIQSTGPLPAADVAHTEDASSLIQRNKELLRVWLAEEHDRLVSRAEVEVTRTLAQVAGAVGIPKASNAQFVRRLRKAVSRRKGLHMLESDFGRKVTFTIQPHAQ